MAVSGSLDGTRAYALDKAMQLASLGHGGSSADEVVKIASTFETFLKGPQPAEVDDRPDFMKPRPVHGGIIKPFKV